MNTTHLLAGRHESALLAFPSVQRMAAILVQRCHNPLWARTAVASLARFQTMTGQRDLEALCEQALQDPQVASQALAAFAAALSAYSESQVATLARGVKLWFSLNGIAVPWRPLAGKVAASGPPVSEQPGVEAVILLALIGSGLHLAELLRLRVGDLGSLAQNGELMADLAAEPLAVQYTPRRGKREPRITFLTFQARQALLAYLAQSALPGAELEPDRLLLTRADGSCLSAQSIARARRRSRALIQAGRNANVELCRATGEFFRRWGLPGSHFSGPEELNIEDYI
ncbi:hypothetical protein EPA93_11980 [Ktedonosporobacter rubrisoli]|uniref:Uncharacterized protein n=1 Tax=Ktedonosporobacter rubrisoli TaxID=2509675 RepID=A0A4V0YYL9_KTERU|nr:hypothetical protein [Ktedonosporobacter rubrisoli]QBD76681.1 hypothetical protein EPA93_11980 [Ktedonosporobacter rubrisoli]